MNNITNIIIALLLSLCPSTIISQSYTNVRKSLGYQATVFTGVYPTDTCLFLKGVMTDSLFRAGSFFSKVGLNGDFFWTKEIIDSNKTIDSWWPDLIKNKDGNFIVSGYKIDFNDDPQIVCFLDEFTPEGVLHQTGAYPSPYYPTDKGIIPLSIISLSTGSYAMVGNLGYVNNKSTYLAKINAQLQLEWIKPFGWDILEGSNSLISGNNSSFIVGGMEYTNLIEPDITARKTIVEFDSTGLQEHWIWKYPVAALPAQRGAPVWDMILLDDGSIVGGSAVSYEPYQNPFNSELWFYPTIFKLNPDHHTLAWETKLGNGLYSAYSHEISQIVKSNDGNGFIGAGSFNLPDSTASGSYIQLGLIAKVAENGDSLWMRYFYYFPGPDGTREHTIYDLKPASDGSGYWICGDIKRQISGESYQQGWLLKIDNDGCMEKGCNLTGIDASATLADKMVVYPNPATEYITIQHTGYAFKKGRLRVVDHEGKIIYDWVSPANELSTILDVSQFSAGNYWVQYLENESIMVSKPFVIVH